MVAIGARAGVTPLPAGVGFARPQANQYGNDLPADSGAWPSNFYGGDDKPGPGSNWPGYVVGGVSPLGSRRALPTVIDASALRHATILVSAGQRGLSIELAPADLQRLAAATVAPIHEGS